MEKGLDGGCVRVPHVYVVHMYVMWTEDDLTTANQRSRLAATVTEDAPSPGVRAVESHVPARPDEMYTITQSGDNKASRDNCR